MFFYISVCHQQMLLSGCYAKVMICNLIETYYIILPPFQIDWCASFAPQKPPTSRPYISRTDRPIKFKTMNWISLKFQLEQSISSWDISSSRSLWYLKWKWSAGSIIIYYIICIFVVILTLHFCAIGLKLKHY